MLIYALVNGYSEPSFSAFFSCMYINFNISVCQILDQNMPMLERQSHRAVVFGAHFQLIAPLPNLKSITNDGLLPLASRGSDNTLSTFIIE